tara:strand:- start:95 stop:259 length:165 start_codon:yes stop_codon:yes gene_type:complete
MPNKKLKIKQQITADYICDEYDRIKKIKDKREREKQLEILKELTKNLGGYLAKE